VLRAEREEAADEGEREGLQSATADFSWAGTVHREEVEQLLTVVRAEADSNRLHAKRDRNRSGDFTERDKGVVSGDGRDRVTEALLGRERG
jgi:hypothetical protein